MTKLIASLQSWLTAAERLSGRLPDAAAGIAHGAWPAAVVALALGVALLVAGAKLGRLLAAAGAAAVGWLAGSALVPSLELWHLPPATPAWAAALILGVLALGAPELYPVVLGIIPGALIGMHLPLAGRAWLGGVMGAVVLALLLFWLQRLVLAATAAVAGALLCVVALLALSPRVPGLGALAHRPLLLFGLAALLAVAGTAYQLGTTRRVRPGWSGSRGQPLRD